MRTVGVPTDDDDDPPRLPSPFPAPVHAVGEVVAATDRVEDQAHDFFHYEAYDLFEMFHDKYEGFESDSAYTYSPAVDAERAGLAARLVGCSEAERTDIGWLPTMGDTYTWGAVDSGRYSVFLYHYNRITVGCDILTMREQAEEYERVMQQAYTTANDRANSAWNKVSVR